MARARTEGDATRTLVAGVAGLPYAVCPALQASLCPVRPAPRTAVFCRTTTSCGTTASMLDRGMQMRLDELEV
jgi:hypothetical protein